MARLIGRWAGDWRKPLDAVELWDDQHRLLGTFPAVLVTELLCYHLRGAHLTGAVREALLAPAEESLPPMTPTRKPLKGANGRRLRGRPD